MTIGLAPRSERTAVPAFGRLVRTEFQRLWARRFTKVLLGLAVIGYLVAVAFIWQQHSKVTAADTAQATSQRDQLLAQYIQDNKTCLAVPGQGVDDCGTPPTVQDFPIDQFLQNRPFLPDDVQPYALAVGVAVALAGFMLAATFIGAEWSSRNVVAWLFYEPRRMRLMWAKIIAVTSSVLVLAALAQLIWALTARWLLSTRGLAVSAETVGDRAPTFWSDLLQLQLRALLIALPVALVGFALANLIRNTAAALGIAFVYLAVVESVIRGAFPNWQPGLFTNSVAAWVTENGITVYGDPEFNVQYNAVVPKEIHISNLHGGVTIIIYAVVLALVSLLLFRRRDIA